MSPRINLRSIFLFFAFVCMAFPLLAQVKLSMALIDTDDINKPKCIGIPDICFSKGSPFILTLDLAPQNNLNFSIKVRLYDDNNLLWQATSADITKTGSSNGIVTFDVNVDLTSVTYVGAGLLIVEAISVAGPGGLASNTGGKGGSLFSNNAEQGSMKWICIRNDCDQPAPARHPCDCEKKNLGFGILAGEQIPGFGGGNDLAVKQFGLNGRNKFVGLQINTSGQWYYQAELLLTSLDFTQNKQPLTPSAPVIEIPYSLVHLRLVPAQVRRQIGRTGSIGVGGGLGFLMRAKADGEQVVTLSESDDNFDRLEPEAFIDARLGNPQKGLSLGFRYGYRWGGIHDVTDAGYSIGKLYLSFGFQ